VEGSRIADAFLSLRAILFILFILSKTLVILLSNFGNRPAGVVDRAKRELAASARRW